MKTTKMALSIIIVGLSVLSYLALDDITTGREPNYWLEWLFVGAGAIIIPLAIFGLLRKNNKPI